jgi:hypothetical protein
MSSPGVRRKTSAAEEGGLMMERWQAESERSQITVSSPAGNSTTPSITQLPEFSQIDVPESSDKNLGRPPLDTVRNHELHEQGPIGSLSRPLIETLGLILIDVRMQSDMAQYYCSLESSCAALFFWSDDLGMLRGELDDVLQDSPQLRDTCLVVLVSISRFVSTCTWMIHNPIHSAIANMDQL